MHGTGDEHGGKNIVVVGAHAFDAEAMAGATAAAAIAAGHRVTLVHLTRGERGNPLRDPAVYGKQLESEMARAAAAFGAEYLWPGYPAGRLPGEEELASELAAIFKRCRADVVITHWRGSWHPRHLQAHQAVMRAVGMISETQEPPWVFFGENCEDLEGFAPDVYVDVSHTAEKAWRAMGEYELFRRESSPDAAGRTVKIPYEPYYRSMAAVRGLEAGVLYAQAFRLARVVLPLPPGVGRGKPGLRPVRVF